MSTIAIGIGVGVLGAGATMYAADQAADAMTDASNSANSTQRYMYEQSRADLQPWRQSGRVALNDLMRGFGYDMGAPAQTRPGLTDLEEKRYQQLMVLSGQMRSSKSGSAPMLDQNGRAELEALKKKRMEVASLDPVPIGTENAPGQGDFNRNFSMNDFKADPGYEFRMQEGMKALEASNAARGGRHSGAAMKEIQRYGQDMASQEYNNAFNRFNAERDARFNRLAGVAGVGQTATNQTIQSGQNYANQYGQNVMGSANAQAAASMAGVNAINGGIGNAVNNWMQYTTMNNLLNRIPGGNTGSGGGRTNLP